MKTRTLTIRGKVLSLAFALMMCLTIVSVFSSEAHAVDNVAKPDYSGTFTAYSTYFNWYPFDSFKNSYAVAYIAGSPYYLYMEYSTNGKKWKRSGKIQGNGFTTLKDQGFKISGLKPNRKYKTRIYYGDIYGNKLSPVRSTGTIRTGAKSKPAVKSVTAKATKVKLHKVKHYGYYTGVYLYTEKYYTYNIKVSVKLKKKPGTKGIWLNGRFLKGNKKKYTTTFVPLYGGYSAKKPRGNIKFTVELQSGQSKIYGGYSPKWKKTMKLK